MSKIIGIDLGTTFSAIAQLDDLGNPEVLASTDSNKKITASAVYVKDKNVVVGDKALDALAATPKNVVTETKRQMENDVVYSLEKGKWIDKEEGDEKSYSPAQISSFILGKLKTYASDVKRAVITVPALFAEKARVATLDAAKMAGIEVIELINERFNVDSMKVKKLLDPNINDVILTKTLLTLAFSISNDGYQKLRTTLLDI